MKKLEKQLGDCTQKVDGARRDLSKTKYLVIGELIGAAAILIGTSVGEFLYYRYPQVQELAGNTMNYALDLFK